MKKVLLILSAFGLFGVWASAQFVIDDSGFDYFDADDGYTAISFEDGVFTLSISDHRSADATLKVSDIAFLPLDEDEDFNPASMLRYLPIEADYNHLSITYPDTSLEAVMGNYDAQLTGLGFSSELEQTLSNSTVMHYTLGETTARVVFTRHGEDVSVAMSTL